MEAFVSIRKAYQKASSVLDPFDVELMLRKLLKQDRATFFTHIDDEFPPQIADSLKEWIIRRNEGEPLQYIIGEQEFYGRPFHVNRSVLIPRPETELLIEILLKKTKNNDSFYLIDVGTGSGVIAITLAIERPNLNIIAIDISKEALLVAKKNAQTLGAFNRITWKEGNYLTPLISAKHPIDILVSNPPYISTNKLLGLKKTDLGFEPAIALDGGLDGLDSYLCLISQITKLEKKPSMLCFEIGADQGARVKKLICLTLPQYQIEIHQDFAGLDRIIVGYLNKNNK